MLLKIDLRECLRVNDYIIIIEIIVEEQKLNQWWWKVILNVMIENNSTDIDYDVSKKLNVESNGSILNSPMMQMYQKNFSESKSSISKNHKGLLDL
jgi:tRNA A22 N-methylase